MSRVVNVTIATLADGSVRADARKISCFFIVSQHRTLIGS